MPDRARRALAPILALTLAAATGCQENTGPLPEDHANLHPTVERVGVGRFDGALAREVRQATARFSSTTQASRAGYAVASECVASPAGGMGFHWLKTELVDPVFDPLRPEAVLYEPRGKRGELTLVAVEYIVVDVGQPRPTFAGQPFDVGGTPLPVPHWSLHVWLFRENPSGMFAPFNPRVTCP
ncbi:MAG: hypothetical protein R2909_12130 [Gemmatimonadales bacterium]